MTQHGHTFAMQEAWDRASTVYLARRGADVSTVSYGNLAPGDDGLGLLGDLRGKRVLDFGCGGGQNAVACALAGAAVVGMDVSKEQLVAARRLAEAHGVIVEWQHGGESQLKRQEGASFDLMLAIQVLPYVDDAAALLLRGRTLLRPGGRVVASFDHPIHNCFYDGETEELSPYPVRSYDELDALRWHFDSGLPMVTKHRPLGEWIAEVIAAGFELQRVVETPAPREVCDELWPEDSPLAPLRNIPHTVILVAGVPTHR